MEQTSKYVWMDGQLVECEQAHVNFLTAGLHYGAAVFEGIRCYDTEAGAAIFRLREHVDRLLRSADLLGLPNPGYAHDALTAGIRDTVRANEMHECYIRPLIYLGEGGWDLTFEGGRAHVGIGVWRWDAFLGDQAREFGVRAGVSSIASHYPQVGMTKAKISGHYVDAMLAKSEARRRGYDEAIMLDPQGFVAECTGENLFLARAGTVSTPPGGAILEGITRDTLMALAGELGLLLVEASITQDELYEADEVFIAGTAAGIVALREIDGRSIGNGRTGPITRRLQSAYTAVTRGRHPRSASWLEYLETQPATGDRDAVAHSLIDLGYGHGV